MGREMENGVREGILSTLLSSDSCSSSSSATALSSSSSWYSVLERDLLISRLKFICKCIMRRSHELLSDCGSKASGRCVMREGLRRETNALFVGDDDDDLFSLSLRRKGGCHVTTDLHAFGIKIQSFTLHPSLCYHRYSLTGVLTTPSLTLKLSHSLCRSDWNTFYLCRDHQLDSFVRNTFFSLSSPNFKKESWRHTQAMTTERKIE